MTRAAGQSRVSTHLPSTSQVCCVQVASAKRPRLSHIGIVAGFAGNGMVHTIEGNTNAAGSREGDGCYDKLRSLSFCGSFIRIPTV